MLTYKDEWVVEQRVKNGRRNASKAIGKVIFAKPKETLTEGELETIWDLCNYGCSQLPPKIFSADTLDCPNNLDAYNGMKFYYYYGIIYIPMQDAPDRVNDDIFIRKHYDTDNGWFIDNAGRTIRDEWVFDSFSRFIGYDARSMAF